MTRVQISNGKTVSLDWLNADHERRHRLLSKTHKQGGHVLCRCRREGLLVHIRCKGHMSHLARNPNSAALHHPNCNFYAASPLVSGQFSDQSQRTNPRYLAHHVWETAGLNQWSSGMVDGEGRPKRSIGLALSLASNVVANSSVGEGSWVTGSLFGESVTIGLLTADIIRFATNQHKDIGETALKRLHSGLAQRPISAGEEVPFEFRRWACVSGEGDSAKAYTFLTNRDLLPISNTWELSLLRTLCTTHSTVIRPIWYVADKRSFPSAVVIENNRGVGVFVHGYHNDTSAEACATKYHLGTKWLER